MIIERLKAVLERDEGCELKVYYINNIPHIGIGINLIAGISDEELEYLGVEDEDDIETITKEQAYHLLDGHIEKFTKVCEDLFKDSWEGLSSERKECLVNIAFNVGEGGIAKFRKMIAAVHAGDWSEAAKQMLNSRAAEMTGDRYKRLAAVMETGDEKHFEVEYTSLESSTQSSSESSTPDISNEKLIEAIDNLSQKADDAISKFDQIIEILNKKSNIFKR